MSAGQTATDLLAQVQSAGKGPGVVACLAAYMSVCVGVGVAVGVGADIAASLAVCVNLVPEGLRPCQGDY